MIHTRSTNAKAFYQNVFINQGRRLWARRWLDTVVVITVNDVDLGLRDVIFFMTFAALYEKSLNIWTLGEVWTQVWNLKELTEGHHQVWNLRL